MKPPNPQLPLAVGPLRRLLLCLLLACGKAEDSGAPTERLGLLWLNSSAPGDLHTSDHGTHDVKLAPGLIILHDPSFHLFRLGERISLTGLEALGEDGDPSDLLVALGHEPLVYTTALLAARDETTYAEAPLFPGETVEETLDPIPGQRLTVAAMFGESNDTVVAALDIDPFDGDRLREGGLPLSLYDLGTELDQEPGLGADQAPRQAAPNTGAAEAEPVEVVEPGHDGYDWLPVEDFASLIATPEPG